MDALAAAIRLRVSSPLEYVAHSLLHSTFTGPITDEHSYARQHALDSVLEVALKLAHSEALREQPVNEVLSSVARALLAIDRDRRSHRVEVGINHAAAEVGINALKAELNSMDTHAQAAVAMADRLQRSEAELKRLKIRHSRLIKMCHDNCPDVLRAFNQGTSKVQHRFGAPWTTSPSHMNSCSGRPRLAGAGSARSATFDIAQPRSALPSVGSLHRETSHGLISCGSTDPNMAGDPHPLAVVQPPTSLVNGPEIFDLSSSVDAPPLQPLWAAREEPVHEANHVTEGSAATRIQWQTRRRQKRAKRPKALGGDRGERAEDVLSEPLVWREAVREVERPPKSEAELEASRKAARARVKFRVEQQRKLEEETVCRSGQHTEQDTITPVAKHALDSKLSKLQHVVRRHMPYARTRVAHPCFADRQNPFLPSRRMCQTWCSARPSRQAMSRLCYSRPRRRSLPPADHPLPPLQWWRAHTRVARRSACQSRLPAWLVYRQGWEETESERLYMAEGLSVGPVRVLLLHGNALTSRQAEVQARPRCESSHWGARSWLAFLYTTSNNSS